MARQKVQTKQIAVRMKESTLQWLEQESLRSGQSSSELVREGIEMLQKSRDTQAVQGLVQEYLSSLDPSEFQDGLQCLIDMIKERVDGEQ
ncbi:MAG: hypothetical protein V7K26_03465 [Nostoc sp.]